MLESRVHAIVRYLSLECMRGIWASSACRSSFVSSKNVSDDDDDDDSSITKFEFHGYGSSGGPGVPTIILSPGAGSWFQDTDLFLTPWQGLIFDFMVFDFWFYNFFDFLIFWFFDFLIFWFFDFLIFMIFMIFMIFWF